MGEWRSTRVISLWVSPLNDALNMGVRAGRVHLPGTNGGGGGPERRE
jgi:hypothetical protein